MSPPIASINIRRVDESRGGEALTPERLLRDAMPLLERCGIGRSPKWVQRVVRDYAASVASNGIPFGAYLLNRVEMNALQRRSAMNDPEVAYLLEYADPTGEAAVNRTIRKRGF